MIWTPVVNVLHIPVLKAPLLLTAARVTTWAQSPPNPPPSQAESAKYGAKRDSLSNVSGVRIAVFINNSINWGLALCESAVVLAKYLPPSTSERILSILAPSIHAASRVQLTPIWLAGCTLLTGGALLRLACYRTMGRYFTWELAVKKDHRLITHGPYSVVRHPAYTGSLMIGVGVVLTHFGPGSWYNECVGFESLGSKLFTAVWTAWAVVIPTLLIRRVNAEDEVLKKEFKEEWNAYAKRTPYRLIPYIY